MRILIVEDEPLAALMADMTLAEDGHHILGPVASARDALATAARERPDLLLTDINLVDATTGTELAREMSVRWGIPCLFVSAQAALARAERGAALGVLHKPYTTAALTSAVAIAEGLLQGRAPLSSPIELELFA